MKFKIDWTVVINILWSLIEGAVFWFILCMTVSFMAISEYLMEYIL